MYAVNAPWPNVIVLDLETARSADDCRYCGEPEGIHQAVSHGALCRRDATTVAGSTFSRIGWGNKAALGLSIGCYYDYADARCHFFDAHTLGETMRHIVGRQPFLVSFNGIQFDFALMRGIMRQRAEESHSTPLACLCDAFKALCAISYDILAEIWKADPTRKFETGLNSLDAISQANGLGAKLSHGSQAPRDWREGQYARVLNHCQDDVLKTKALFEQIIETGVIMRGDGQPIALPRPEGLEIPHASQG